MTHKQKEARIEEIRAAGNMLTTPEADARELISYYNDKELRDIASRIQARIKTIARKKKYYAQYWRCKDMLQWIRDEENKRPMTSDIFAEFFPINAKK
jgi:hypothetical protein|tara:strand:- start:2678 stop:2971 length:294 start_codon:yes stop_codon:yes gene_type:complete